MEWISSLFLTGYGHTEKQNILLQQMHKKEFWIFTNKCGNNLKHENEAELKLKIFRIYSSKSEILFYASVEEGCFASLTIARGKQT